MKRSLLLLCSVGLINLSHAGFLLGLMMGSSGKPKTTIVKKVIQNPFPSKCYVDSNYITPAAARIMNAGVDNIIYLPNDVSKELVLTTDQKTVSYKYSEVHEIDFDGSFNKNLVVLWVIKNDCSMDRFTALNPNNTAAYYRDRIMYSIDPTVSNVYQQDVLNQIAAVEYWKNADATADDLLYLLGFGTAGFLLVMIISGLVCCIKDRNKKK